MKVLCVGDLFLSSGKFREAVEKEFGAGDQPEIREVMWAGEKAEEQHHLQQIMEVDGPEAVPTPDEIVEAVGDTEIIAVHFAPIPKAVLEAGPDLKAVVVARAGYENINLEEVVGGVTEEAARLTGLKAGTPVVGGAHDVDCAAVGVGCVEVGDLTMIAGTWSINEVVGDEPAFIEGSACRNFVKPGLYQNMSASPTSATNLEWFVRRMCPLEYKTSKDMGISPFAFVNEEVKGVMNDESRVFYHPFLYSSPHGDDATGGFFGLRGWHTRGHLLRALFEGVAFNHKTHVGMLREAFKVKRVRLTGGGSTSRTWAQIFADTIDETVEVMGAGETAALGAALCAGVGTGVYSSIDDAANNVVRTFRIHEPDPRNSKRLAEAYETHLALVGAMNPVWERTG